MRSAVVLLAPVTGEHCGVSHKAHTRLACVRKVQSLGWAQGRGWDPGMWLKRGPSIKVWGWASARFRVREGTL